MPLMFGAPTPVGWMRGADYFDYQPSRLFRSDRVAAEKAAQTYGERTELETRALAERAGAGVADLEAAFADAATIMPEAELIEDGNHATLAGGYLAALVLYGRISQAPLANVTWRPAGMSDDPADRLVQIAKRHLQ